MPGPPLGSGTFGSDTGGSADSAETEAVDDTADGGGEGGGCSSMGDCSPGEACGDAEDCASGHCVDGVCCASECDAGCYSCAPETGECVPDGAGSDPAGDCASGTCDGAGQCTSGEPQWADSYGAPPDGDADGNDDGTGITVDGAGNVYVVGAFSGSIDIAGPTLTAGGGNDMFVASFAPDGAPRWSIGVGTVGHDRGNGIAITSEGTVVAVGIMADDPGVGAPWPEQGPQGLVLNLNPDGTVVGSTAIVGTESSRAMGVAAGPDGSVYVTGGFFGTLQANTEHVGAGNEDLFVVRLDSSLAPVWSWTRGGATKDLGRGIAVGPGGELAVTGFLDEGLDEGVDSSADVYIAVFGEGPNPAPTWDRRYESPTVALDKGHHVEFTPNGDLVAAGFFGGSIDFDDGVQTTAGDRDGFVARLRGDTGAPLWATTFGAAGIDIAHGAVLDPAGNVTVVGQFSEQPSLGPDTLAAVGERDALVAKLRGDDGAFLWSAGFGGTASDLFSDAVHDSTGAVLVTGRFSSSAQFGPSDLTASDGSDVLIMKLDP
ncbi:MAG: hypothetical protein AAF799_26005 [Myxococcota bacterium]